MLGRNSLIGNVWGIYCMDMLGYSLIGNVGVFIDW